MDFFCFFLILWLIRSNFMFLRSVNITFFSLGSFLDFPSYFPYNIFTCFWIFCFNLNALTSIGSRKICKIWFSKENFTLNIIQMSEKCIKFTKKITFHALQMPSHSRSSPNVTGSPAEPFTLSRRSAWNSD